MANYTAITRSYYFQVKDPDAFEQWIKHVTQGIEADAQVWTKTYDPQVVGFGWYGDIPAFIYDESLDDEVEIDFFGDLAQHLIQDEVAVVQSVGNEKLRYLVGQAIAVHSNGEVITLGIEEIYEVINDIWGVNPSSAEY